jgi:PAS domain S-box-containing protein
MRADLLAESQRLRLSDLIERAAGPAVVAILYYLGAEAAFFLGTLSDQIFAPFWPPNVVLFCALLLVPRQRWDIYVVAAFPAHVVAELSVGMTAPQLLVAFATNCLVAVLNVVAVQRFLRGPPWLGDLRNAALYLLLVALAGPALCAFGGAFVRILGGGPIGSYWLYWLEWFGCNAIIGLTLAPAALTWLVEGRASFSSIPTRARIEGLVTAVALTVVCAVAFELGAGRIQSGFLPALLCAPLPLILWCAVRFGAKGASAAVLIVTVVLVWSALRSPGMFATASPDTNVLALQAYLAGLATPILLLGAAIDEARAAARTARHSEERMTFAAAAVHIAFWEIDRASNRLWMADHGRSMLGLPAQGELTEGMILAAAHPEDREQVIEAMRAPRSGELASGEIRVVLPDGGIRWLLARSHAEGGTGDRPPRISGFFADITPRKQAEGEAEERRREMAHLMRVSVLGELSGAIAHELKQPLTAILANAQAGQLLLARNVFDPAEVKDILDDIVAEDDRAAEVINRLRCLLKKGEVRHERIDLADFLEPTLRLLHSELVSRRIRLDARHAGKLPPVLGDAVQLQQVVLNLVMNAMEAVAHIDPSQRRIAIATRTTAGNAVEVAITDSGGGIARDQQELVLQPFFTTKEHGLGLGLAICLTIIKSHGGGFRIENVDGGARAAFTLPAAPPGEDMRS